MSEHDNIMKNPLSVSWHDSAWIPHLEPSNVMAYFGESSNLFYDRTCNNEVIKMQRLSPEHLQNMIGVEYVLLHVQEPILYIVRKQQRHSPTQVTPISDYYIVAGIVYQAPDLGSVVNSRLLSTVTHLQSAFEEARSYSKYHPSKGYCWQFSNSGSAASKAEAEKKAKLSTKKKSKKSKAKEREKRVRGEPSSIFQRRRVNMILDLMTRKFPPKLTPPAAAAAPSAAAASKEETKEDKQEAAKEVKSEKAEANNAAPGSQATSTAGIKREAAGPISRGPDPKKSKMS